MSACCQLALFQFEAPTSSPRGEPLGERVAAFAQARGMRELRTFEIERLNALTETRARRAVQAAQLVRGVEGVLTDFLNASA